VSNALLRVRVTVQVGTRLQIYAHIFAQGAMLRFCMRNSSYIVPFWSKCSVFAQCSFALAEEQRYFSLEPRHCDDYPTLLVQGNQGGWREGDRHVDS
jgi:hypothetical protein